MEQAFDHTLRYLFEIACDSRQGLRHQLERLLQFGCDRFGMEIGTLARVRDREYRIVQGNAPAPQAWQEGDVLSLQDTYCDLTLSAAGPVGISDVVRSHTPDHPAWRKFSLQAYLGIPIRVDGEIYGTLSFAARHAMQHEFTPTDLDDLRLMGLWLEAELSRRGQEHELRLMEERFRQGFYAAPGAMLIINRKGEIEQVNTEAEHLFGYDEAQLVGKPVEVLVPEGFRASHPRLREGYQRAPQERPMGKGRDLLAQNARGEVFPVEVGLNPIRTREHSLVLCAVMDLTERKRYEKTILEQTELLVEANERLSQRATTDALTNLSNRHHFMAKLNEYMSLAHRSGECVSILMLDVDHFKKYNDTHGHIAGDEALKTVARELSRHTRGVDIVARYGGEEFIILLPAADREGAQVIGERIRLAVEQISHLHRPVTLSGGIATAVDIANPAKKMDEMCRELIERADQALYRSKQLGRNRITHFEPERTTQ
jgi:diguanylate cyclase (GGDEF)-like protein/PAS domain S-box-containing protein